jgi:hypothetical protein
MDTWIVGYIHVSKYPWIVGYLILFSIRIHGYLDISTLLDSWIIGYFNFLVSGYLARQKGLDIDVFGYPTIRISHEYFFMYCPRRLLADCLLGRLD